MRTADETLTGPIDPQVVDRAVTNLLRDTTAATDVRPPVPHSRRRFRRWPVSLHAAISVLQAPRPCSVHDLSPAGARVRLTGSDELAPGTEVVLELDGFGPIPAEVRHTVDGYTGLLFLLDEASEIRLARHLVSMHPDSEEQPRTLVREATLRPRGAEAPCVVEDISRTGARILSNDTRHLMEGDELVLRVAGFGDIAAVVQRLEGSAVALTFRHALAGELPFLNT